MQHVCMYNVRMCTVQWLGLIYISNYFPTPALRTFIYSPFFPDKPQELNVGGWAAQCRKLCRTWLIWVDTKSGQLCQLAAMSKKSHSFPLPYISSSSSPTLSSNLSLEFDGNHKERVHEKEGAAALRGAVALQKKKVWGMTWGKKYVGQMTWPTKSW